MTASVPALSSLKKYPTSTLEWARQMWDEMQQPQWLYAKQEHPDKHDQYFGMRYADFRMASPFWFNSILTDPDFWERPQTKLLLDLLEKQKKGQMSKKKAEAIFANAMTEKYVKPLLSQPEPNLEKQAPEMPSTATTTPPPKKRQPSQRMIAQLKAAQQQGKS